MDLKVEKHRVKIVETVAGFILPTVSMSTDIRKDINGIPTLGYYHPVNPITTTEPISDKKAIEWLVYDISNALNKAVEACKGNKDTTQNQIIAITSYLLFSPYNGYDNKAFLLYHSRKDYKKALHLLEMKREIGGIVCCVNDKRRLHEVDAYKKEEGDIPPPSFLKLNPL